MNFSQTGAAALLLTLANCAWADRPISGDMASTADPATCQVESWHERAGSDRALVVSPACGIAPGLELGLSYSAPTPHDVVHAEAGLALKWAPASWRLDTAAGTFNAGFKAEGGWVQLVGAPWRNSDATVAGLLSWTMSNAWSVHLNAGVSRDRASATRAAVGYLGVLWAPLDPVQLFVDAQVNNKKAIFGGAVASAGGRWWLVKDRIGLDFTASRERGAGGPTRYTIGAGWYGIGS